MFLSEGGVDTVTVHRYLRPSVKLYTSDQSADWGLALYTILQLDTRGGDSILTPICNPNNPNIKISLAILTPQFATVSSEDVNPIFGGGSPTR